MVREEVTYRRGVAADAGDLAAFGSQSFVDAYGTTSSRRAMALHVASTYSADLQRAELEDPESWTIVGDRDGEIVAAALMQWHEPPLPIDPPAKWAEIRRFYLGRAYWRTGVSTDLMVAALQSIRDGGGDAVWLQAWEHAPQAIGFYRKWGFREAGHVPFRLGTELQRDILLARTLTTS